MDTLLLNSLVENFNQAFGSYWVVEFSGIYLHVHMKKGFVSLKFWLLFLKVTVGYDYPIILIESLMTQVYLLNLILAMHTPLNAFGMSQKQCPSSTPSQISEGIFIRAIRSLVILWFSLWKCSILCFSSNFLAMKNYAIFLSLEICGLTWNKRWKMQTNWFWTW
jgi:hypothetical protein